MLISTALLLYSTIRNSACTPAKLPCRRVVEGYETLIYNLQFMLFYTLFVIIQKRTVCIVNYLPYSPYLLLRSTFVFAPPYVLLWKMNRTVCFRYYHVYFHTSQHNKHSRENVYSCLLCAVGYVGTTEKTQHR
jgi:hypothetical protein